MEGCRLKRVILLGDHNQLPPITQNVALAQATNFNQSLFARLIRLGVPHVQLDAQGRCRPSLATLFAWRYPGLSNLPCVTAPDARQHESPLRLPDDQRGRIRG